MSFLSTWLHQSAPIGQWPVIASIITNGFQEIKLNWFSQCVVSIDIELLADKGTAAKVVQYDLGGSAALAITAYQISCASNMILKNTYVPKPSSKDFVGLLCGRVSGASQGDLLKYLRRYEEVRDDASTQQFRFGVDVAGYIINAEPPMNLSLRVASMSHSLTARSCLVIAQAFADPKEIHSFTKGSPR